MYDVITVGSATLDVFIHTGQKYVKNKCYKFPVGTKIVIENINYNSGGGATNVAVSLSRLGLKTSIVSKIGIGHTSHFILEELKKEKINTKLLIKSKEHTGYSMILDAEGTDRSIFTYKGSNAKFKFNEINKKELKKTKLIYLTSFKKAFKESEKVALFAKKNGIKLAFNPSCYLAEKGYKHLKKVLDCTNYLILNKEEASLIVKGKTKEELAKKLYEKGPEIVVITDGKNKAVAYNGKFHYSKPKKFKIVETTGAGDAFGSTFVGCLIKKKSISKSLNYAQKNAESVITHIGAKNKLLNWKQLVKL